MQKRNLLIFITVIVSIMVGMIAFSNHLLGFIRTSLEEDVKINLMEITRQNAQVVAEQVNGDLNDLALIGELVINKFPSLDDPEIWRFLKEQAKKEPLGELLLSSPEGQGISSNDQQIDISKRLYFKEAKKGIRHISELVVSKIDGEETYVASVPLYQDGVLVATIHRYYPAESFSQAFPVSLFNDRGYINIVNDAGEVMVHSAENGMNPINNNYFRELYLLGNGQQAEQMQQDLANNGSGFIELALHNDRSFAAYTKIDQVYGWSLITAVPSEVISKNADAVSQVVLSILALFSCALMLACALVYFIIDKRNKALSRMAFVDQVTKGNTYHKFFVDTPTLFHNNPDTTYMVAYLDVDNFKFINNMHGYDYGDEIIRGIYDGVGRLIGEKETIARITADRFVALLEWVPEAVAEENVSQVIAPIVEKAGFLFTISCGFYMVTAPTEQLESMIDKAAMASKTIKENTKKQWRIMMKP